MKKMKVEFDAGQKEVLDGMLSGLPGVRPGPMFGFPGYWAGRRLFACLFGEGVGLKLPPKRAEEMLSKPGFSPFMPRGRRMAAWVMVTPRRPADLKRHAGLFRESLDYVVGLAASGPRGRTGSRTRASKSR